MIQLSRTIKDYWGRSPKLASRAYPWLSQTHPVLRPVRPTRFSQRIVTRWFISANFFCRCSESEQRSVKFFCLWFQRRIRVIWILHSFEDYRQRLVDFIQTAGERRIAMAPKKDRHCL